jgi:hypothetical protein
MKFRIVFCATLAVCVGMVYADLAVGAKSLYGPVNFYFDDHYYVRSDGLGTYVNGIGGVNSSMSVYGDWGFYLGLNKRGDSTRPRSFVVDLSSPVDSRNAPMAGDFTCSVDTSTQVNVKDINSVPIGATAYRQASIDLECHPEAGVQHCVSLLYGFHGPYAPDDPTPGVAVTRVSSNQWQVAALPNVPYGGVGRLVGMHQESDGTWPIDWQAYYNVPLSVTLNKK